MGRYEPIARWVEVEVKLVDRPGKQGTLALGASQAAEKGEIKRRRRVSR